MASLAGASVSYTITAPSALASPGGTGSNDGLSGPYLYIVVTDGSGGFSYLLLDAMPAPLGQQRHDFSTARYASNESSGASTLAFIASLGPADLVIGTTNSYDFSDIASLSIATAGMSSNPGGVTPVGGWTSFGTTDSFLFVSGNRGSSPTPDVTIDNVTFVPEPSSLALLALGLVGLALRHRKLAA